MNARPNEISIRKDWCKDEWGAPEESLACGRQRDDEGEYVWDSQVSNSVM